MLTSKQLDGIDASWGNADALIEFIHKIGNAEGIGIELGRGSRHMAELVGGNSKDWAMEVNNLELPAHDPRAYTSMAVSFVTSTRGACHLHGSSEGFEVGRMLPEIGINVPENRFSNKKKGMAAAVYQDWAALFNSLTQCMIYPAFMTFKDQVDLLNAINGWDMTPQELMLAGERINTLQHLINIDRGLTIEDMKLPKRVLEPLKEGGTQGHVPDLKMQLDEYFETRKWRKDGVPTEEKLRELNLI
jgi:aldehyde:ferredoxin oxidoreductase